MYKLHDKSNIFVIKHVYMWYIVSMYFYTYTCINACKYSDLVMLRNFFQYLSCLKLLELNNET